MHYALARSALALARRALGFAQLVENKLDFARAERARGVLGEVAKPGVQHEPAAHFAPGTIGVDVRKIVLGQLCTPIGFYCDIHVVKVRLFLGKTVFG